MLFRNRPDGTYIKVPSFKKVLTYTCPTRDEASLYYKDTIVMDAAIALLLKENRGKSAKDRINILHLIVASFVRTIVERPLINTFVSGHSFYQRNEISFSLVAKKQLTDEGTEGLVKVCFQPMDTIWQVAERMRRAVEEGKSDRGSSSEREVDFLMSMPQPLASAFMWLYRLLDTRNLLPGSLIANDPSYSSGLITNLGSIGIDGVFHHLFNWGNSGLIMAIGKIKKAPVNDNRSGIGKIASVLDIYMTLDDRLADGTYYGNTLKTFKNYMENPDRLFEQPSYTKEQIDALMLKKS
ncbi:MAG TPA: 2-oxo acid dehydrogenase subunit E2 [Bacillota bacterium]|nr:2-oxo acid dehydrogenase subunit E2 [Bacillota bacterium]